MSSFKNRMEAAAKLAVALQKYKNEDTIVFAIPRGAVPMGTIISKELNAPLDLIIVRKIGHPYNPEYALAVISENGDIVANEEDVKTVDKKWFVKEMEKERQEAKRRREVYLKNKLPINIKNKTVIIVDDGLATGLTMLAAIKELKHREPAKIIAAVPVAPKDTAEKIKNEVDEFICLETPEYFLGSVGAYYQDFPQVEDAEVIKIMNEKEKITDPFVFYMPGYKKTAAALTKKSGYAKAEFKINYFANGEEQIIISKEISKKSCLIIGNVAPPAENIMRLTLLSHTLKKEGAKNIAAIIPYLSYMRLEKNEQRKSLNADWLAKLLESSGIDEIITADIHSDDAKKYFSIPVKTISPAQIFADEINNLKFNNITIVAPDEGAIERSQNVRRLLKIKCSFVFFKKHRTNKKIISKITGEINGNTAIIIDDILDTGNTLIACCKILKNKGIKKIIIMVTHGLFTGKKWKELWKYGVQNIYTTNSLPKNKKLADKRINTLSLNKLY